MHDVRLLIDMPVIAKVDVDEAIVKPKVLNKRDHRVVVAALLYVLGLSDLRSDVEQAYLQV